MGEIKVTIYERVKLDNKWTRVRVEIPEGRKRNARLFLKDDRQGKFQLSWYEKRSKKWQHVTNPNDEQKMPQLSHAIKQADDKSWFLNRWEHFAATSSAALCHPPHSRCICHRERWRPVWPGRSG